MFCRFPHKEDLNPIEPTPLKRMDPFRQDPYDSDSGDDGSFTWPSGTSERAQALTEHAKALMRGDLEVSPLVTVVPPMPEVGRPAAALSIPSSFRAVGGGMQQVALKKRKIDPQSVARTFVGEPQEMVLPPPSTAHNRDPAQQHPLPGEDGTPPSSSEEMRPPAPPAAAAVARASQLVPNPVGADMLTLLTDAASQSAPVSAPPVSAPPVSAPPVSAPPVSGSDTSKTNRDSMVCNPSDISQDSRPVGAFHQGLGNGGQVEATTPSEATVTILKNSCHTGVSDDKAVPTQGAAVLGTPTKGPSAEEAARTDDQFKRIPIKRKLALSKSKKVLTAKKERDAAEALLSGKDDLLDILPREDCFFLAEESWIFTVQQLRAVLGVGSSLSEDKVKSYREMLISKLEKKQEALKSKVPNMDPDVPRKVIDSVASISKDDSESLAPKAGEEEVSGDTSNEKHAEVSPEERVTFWKRQVELAICNRKPIDLRFPLDGPISSLFPKSARNFLATAKVGTLFKFLSLKKTETGAICDFLKVWRRECQLPELSLLALAKHLLGITARVEAAIAVVEPIDERNRRWMIDPIIVMTGAARDFLVEDQGIMTATEFVDARTKELALKLADWREKHGMVPLKGSGKVAMISGWKAAAREAMEAEVNHGKVLPNIDLEAEAAVEVTQVANRPLSSKGPVVAVSPKPPRKSAGPTKEKAPTVKTPPTLSGERQVQYALSTKLFLEDVLGNVATLHLEKAGISTASEFFSMTPEERSALIRILVNYRTIEDPSGSGFVALIDEWSKKLTDALEKMTSKDHSENKEQGLESPLNKKPRLSEKKPQEKKQEGTKEVTKGPVTRKHKDPFDSLSSVTKRFLSTLGIHTAEAFLKTRTTDIAQVFVEFRQREGMPDLKGLGAIASVSGWKANVRKAAKDLGKNDIVVMEPENKTSWGPFSRQVARKPKNKLPPTSSNISIPRPKTVLVAHSDVLDKKPRVLFAVANGSSTF